MKQTSQVWKAGRAFAAQALLLAFTILLPLKIDGVVFRSWWLVFTPLWLFHLVLARGRFSIPFPSNLDVYPWAPCHAVFGVPCHAVLNYSIVYIWRALGGLLAYVSYKIVWLPIFLLEALIIIDNIRILLTPTPGLMEQLSLRKKHLMPLQKMDYYAKHQASSHFIIIFSMLFIVGATWGHLAAILHGVAHEVVCIFGLLLLLVIAQVVACRVWIMDALERDRQFTSSSSRNLISREIIGAVPLGLVILVFQILLSVYLFQGGKKMSLAAVFSPLHLLQGVGLVFYALQLVDEIALLLLHNQDGDTTFFRLTSTAYDFLQVMRCGTRFLGWWSIDDEEQVLQVQDLELVSVLIILTDMVQKVSKNDIVEEVRSLQAAIHEQINATESSKREIERLREEKIACKICFEGNISVMLMPCRHRILCRSCADKCSSCPICRTSIDSRLHSVDIQKAKEEDEW